MGLGGAGGVFQIDWMFAYIIAAAPPAMRQKQTKYITKNNTFITVRFLVVELLLGIQMTHVVDPQVPSMLLVLH